MARLTTGHRALGGRRRGGGGADRAPLFAQAGLVALAALAAVSAAVSATVSAGRGTLVLSRMPLLALLLALRVPVEQIRCPPSGAHLAEIVSQP